MDEVKLKFNGGFMKTIIAKIVRVIVLKKVGFDIDIGFNNIEVSSSDNIIRIHLDLDAQTTTEEFEKMVQTII